MPKCEICGKEMARRVRHTPSGKLTCHWCNYRIRNPIKTAIEATRFEEQIKIYRQERPILPTGTRYKFNSPYSAVPPKDILDKSILALDMSGFYSEFSTVLGDYYDFQAPRYLDSPESVPKGAVACYYNNKNTVYAAKGRMTRHTAFHEFWHALENHGVVPRTIDSEKNANIYADASLSRLETKKRM